MAKRTTHFGSAKKAEEPKPKSRARPREERRERASRFGEVRGRPPIGGLSRFRQRADLARRARGLPAYQPPRPRPGMLWPGMMRRFPRRQLW